MPEVTLDQGTLRYTDTGGDQPVVVLVHGLLVNGSLWRDVLPGLAGKARVVVPELPLGSHQVPLHPEADLSPPGLARLIADFLAALELSEVTLVANDTGGAITQLVLTRHPERLARVVLTNCDSHENFLPPAFRPLRLLGWVPGVLSVAERLARFGAVRRLFGTFGGLSSAPVDDERLVSWLTPMRAEGVRRDVAKVLRGINPRYTLEAATRLSEFAGPALLLWGRRDRFFTPAHAQRLADEFADARLVWLERSRTFVPIDAPDELSAQVAEFVRRPARLS